MRVGIKPSESAVGSLDVIAPGIFGFRTLIANVFGVSNDDGSWSLIDAGLSYSASRILSWAAEHHGTRPPDAILLTHGHFDHVGALEELVASWDVPVYAHPLELPYLTGRSEYPPPDPSVGGGAIAFLAALYPRGPINLGSRVRPLPADGTVPNLPGWRWIHTPGHTAGHVSFFRESDKVLIAGDAISTTKQESLFSVLVQRPEVNGPPAYYTSDWGAAAESVRCLAELEPAVIACGHGMPIIGPEAAADLRELARAFPDRAVPARGRYVRRPAVTDEDGVVSVPPPVLTTAPRIVLAAAAAGVILYRLNRRRSRRGGAYRGR